MCCRHENLCSSRAAKYYKDKAVSELGTGNINVWKLKEDIIRKIYYQ
jgi:hypothetical protein